SRRISFAAFLLVILIVASTTIRAIKTADDLPASVNNEMLAKKHAVRLHPNPTSDGTTTVTSSIPDNELHFYVFDLEGTMLHQLILKGSKQHTIRNLKKGIYMYEVFKNDESIEQGKIICK
ncbi:MAG: T9SS type A sorting domain-containing protein, partial [Chitinophagaceae bacterium]|nr:T9SS type A sorting domain-containing protein [Chitinophagaceae bacterium]